MIKLYKMDNEGRMRFCDWGVKGLEKIYLRLGYLILVKRVYRQKNECREV